jgi:hypothetical protein
LEADKQQAVDAVKKQLAESDARVARLTAELEETRQQNAVLREKEIRAAEECAQAVARALEVQRVGLDRERVAQQRWLKEDNQRLKNEAAALLDNTMDRHREYLDNQRQQYLEAMELLKTERERLFSENESLKQEVLNCKAQVSWEYTLILVNNTLRSVHCPISVSFV